MKNESDNEVQWNSIALPSLFWKTGSVHRNFRGALYAKTMIVHHGRHFFKMIDDFQKQKFIRNRQNFQFILSLGAEGADFFCEKFSPKSERTSKA